MPLWLPSPLTRHSERAGTLFLRRGADLPE